MDGSAFTTNTPLNAQGEVTKQGLRRQIRLATSMTLEVKNPGAPLVFICETKPCWCEHGFFGWAHVFWGNQGWSKRIKSNIDIGIGAGEGVSVGVGMGVDVEVTVGATGIDTNTTIAIDNIDIHTYYRKQ